jgi:hypothetical protein
MRGSKSSANSPISNAQARASVVFAAVVVSLAVLSAAAVVWCASRGYTLNIGDAEAHLNIARRIFDSRTPGPEQIGTVWLPLPHLLMVPFVINDDWWRSGIGGSIPSALCFVLAGTFLYRAALLAFSSQAAALTATFVFALNPNLLYLQSVPMTEPVFAAALTGLLRATLRFRESQSSAAVVAVAVAANCASLTRYEGWFLIPFVAVYIWIAGARKRHAVVFAALASIGPLAWLAHNAYYYGNPLEFYNGAYSPMAIYQRQLSRGMAPYPGDHNWAKAAQYYVTAIRLAIGWPVVALGVAGAVCLWVRRIWWVFVLLALPPLFYLWSIHSSNTPVFVPQLWPFARYNIRYGLAALPLTAFGAAGLTVIFRNAWRSWAAAATILATTCAWAITTTPACWEEAVTNSSARRAWTREAADFMAAHYRSGSGVIYSFGDLTAILREARIPLREGLHQDNRPNWDAAVQRPDLFLREEWAIAMSGDRVATATLRTKRPGPYYVLRRQVIVKGAPVIEIYQRSSFGFE